MIIGVKLSNERVSQIILSASLIFFTILIALLFNPYSDFEFFLDYVESFGEFIFILIIMSVLIGTLISQLTIITWNIFYGTIKIEYSRDFLSTIGNRRITQLIFDQFKFGCNQNSQLYICNQIQKYISSRIVIYENSLVAIITSIVIIFTEIYFYLQIDSMLQFWLLLAIILNGLIITISLIYKKKVAFEIYEIEKCYLQKYRSNILKEIESYQLGVVTNL